MKEQVRIPDAIHHELLNWARWCWLGPWPHPLPSTQCGSLESQYRAPPEWDEDLAEAPRSYIRPNERSAKVVQGVYDRLEGFGRLVLKSEYPGRAERGTRTEAAHRIGLTVQQYENWLRYAVNQVEGAFNVVRA